MDLQPGTGPAVTGGTWATMIMAPANASPGTTDQVPSDQHKAQEHAAAKPQHAGDASGPTDSGHPGAGDSDIPDGESSWVPDRPALIAAGPPADLSAAVAEHLLAAAESPHAPAFVRAGAVGALHSLLGQLPPELNGCLASHFFTMADHPILTEHDQAELASQDLLSRGRMDMGAKDLPMLALVCAATAASLAAEAGANVQNLPAADVNRIVTYAVKLLHSQDRQALKYGAMALALAAKCRSGLACYTATLVVHPSDEVRVVVASMAPLDEVTQRILVADSSPQVRIRLASRARELDEDILAALSTDEHPDVVKALASARRHQADAPEHGGAPGR